MWTREGCAVIDLVLCLMFCCFGRWVCSFCPGQHNPAWAIYMDAVAGFGRMARKTRVDKDTRTTKSKPKRRKRASSLSTQAQTLLQASGILRLRLMLDAPWAWP